MRTLKILSLLIFGGMSSLWGGPITTITVFSQGTAANPFESNNRTGANVSLFNTALPFNGYAETWQALPGAVVWVSFKDTICPGCVDGTPDPITCPGCVNGNLTPQFFYNPTSVADFVTFTQLFTIPAGMVAIDGVLNILSDDSVTVLLNGSPVGTYIEPMVAPFNFDLHGGNGIAGGIPLSSFQPALVSGQNTLQFEVTNLGAGNVGSHGNGTGGVASFGIEYVLTLDLVPTPEPGSMVLMALGLLLLGNSRFCRRTKGANHRAA